MNWLRLQTTSYWVPLSLFLCLLFLQLSPWENQIGHDYYYHFPKLLAGAIFFWQNGLAIPYHTPSLCGGIPMLADPQSLYYSPLQLLTFFFEPHFASQLYTLLCATLGYIFFFKLCERGLKFHRWASHLGALLWVMNGFSLAHLFVGHVSHATFYLLPGFYLYCLGPLIGMTWLQSSTSLSFLAVYLIYSGSFHVAVVGGLAFAIFFPYCIIRYLREKRIAELIKTLSLTGLIFAIACCGKLLLTYQYSKTFYVNPIDRLPLSLWHFVLQYFWFLPHSTPEHLSVGQWAFGAWEYVGFVSKATLVGALAAGYFAAKKIESLAWVIPTALVTVFIILISAGRLSNETLPFFSHYHNPAKCLAALIPILCLLSAFASNNLLSLSRIATLKSHFAIGFLSISAILLGEYGYHSNFFVSHQLGLSFEYQPQLYSLLKSRGRLLPTDHVTEKAGQDIEGLASGTTSLRCYEALFGYRLENARFQLTPGRTELLFNGRHNLNHPGCFTHPDYFGCKAWDRIPATEPSEFEKFRRGEIAFAIPSWHDRLVKTGLFVYGLLFILWSLELTKIPSMSMRFLRAISKVGSSSSARLRTTFARASSPFRR